MMMLDKMENTGACGSGWEGFNNMAREMRCESLKKSSEDKVHM